MASQTEAKSITFIDYNFILRADKTIEFDKELNIENLSLQVGDVLTVHELPGTKSMVLKKRSYRSRNDNPF